MKKLPTALTGSNAPSKISSKRLVTMMLAVTFVIVVLANVFFGRQVTDFVFEGLVTVLVWGLGFVGSEQFAEVMKQRRTPTKPSTRKPKVDASPNGDDEHENF